MKPQHKLKRNGLDCHVGCPACETKPVTPQVEALPGVTPLGIKPTDTHKPSSVEGSSHKIIAALKKSGYTMDETREIFHGIFHGATWNEYDLAVAIVDAFHGEGR